MNKILKCILINVTTIVMIILNIIPATAVSFSTGDTILLEKDHDCISLLKFKDSNMMKGVAYVVYKNSSTNEKQPAFCVEPDKPGIGTGADESYDVTLSMLSDEKLWRVLYKGFMGSSYQEWNLECEDDFYYATKTAIHSLVQNISPIEKYEEPTRVGYGENVSFEDVLRRARKVLDVAQKLYEYGLYGDEKYKEPKIEIEKISEEEQELNNENYLVQNYKVVGNRKTSSFDISIKDFPENTVVQKENDGFKILIPTKNILENVEGTIEIDNVKIKTYPVFYAKAYDENTQSYITYASNYEEVKCDKKEIIDAYKSKIIVNKIDGQNKKPLAGVIFNLLDGDKTKINHYETNENGQILIENLKQGKYYLQEVKTQDKYYELKDEIEIELNWNEEKEIIVENEKVDIKVNIEKAGVLEAKTGEIIEYQFKNIENKSNVMLDSFIWTDYIPTDAVRVTKIETGIWNQKNVYSVWIKTNKNDYKMIKNNLDTTVNNEIDFNGLEDDEFITEYQLRFENTDIGFKENTEPKLYCKVLENIENGCVFTNKTDVVGKYKNNESKEESSWQTIVYTPKTPAKILPRTGK